jgi:hypothetical protein
LFEVPIPIPADYTQARRREHLLFFASALLGPFLIAAGSGYAMRDTLRFMALTTGPMIVSFSVVSGIRRLAR